MARTSLDSDPCLPAIRIQHSFHEGERVNFRSREELALGLEDGYLELQLVDDQGLIHCIVRRVTRADGYEHEGYLYTEAPVGKTHEWAVLHYLRTPEITYRQEVYETLDGLLEEIDVHAFLWYPLTTVSTFPFYRQKTYAQIVREEALV
jgi:hypothetical protein